MPKIQGQKSHDGQNPIHLPEPNIPIPLPTRYGGLGGEVDPMKDALLIGDGKQFIALPTIQKPNHFLQTGENGIKWSAYTLELTGDARLDQSLHTAASPKFAGLGIETEAGGISWIKRKNSAKEFYLYINSNCQLDQNLSKDSCVQFDTIKAKHIELDIVRLSPTVLTPEAAGKGAIAMTKDGACMSDGEQWMTLHGNIHGKGKQNRLAYFDGDITITSCISLMYEEGKLGLGVEKIEAALHVAEEVKFDKGALLGELKKNSRTGCFGLRHGKAAIKTEEGFKVFGSGEGNLKGKGKKGTLAYFREDDELIDSEIFISDKGAICTHNAIIQHISTDNVHLAENFGDGINLSSLNGHFYMNDKRVAAHFKRGALTCDFAEVSGEGKLVDGDIKLIAKKASAQEQGIASFSDNDFSVTDGAVCINWSKIPRASKDNNGILYATDYNYFANKAQAFDVGAIKEGVGISLKGTGKAFGGDLLISAVLGDHVKAGAICLCEEDFVFRNGIACLRNKPITEYSVQQIFDTKQDRLPLNIGRCGVGFASNYVFGIIGTETVDLKLAISSAETMGISRFNQDDFKVSDGCVFINKTPIATSDREGLMSKEQANGLAKAIQTLELCPKGKGEEGTLAIWTKDGIATATDFVNISGGISYAKIFEAANIRSKGAVILGTIADEAEAIGAGAMKYEQGCLQVSNGQQWISLRAGGLIGEGRANTMAFWSSETSLSAPKALFWDEINNRLGFGIEKALANIHIETAAASMIVTDTKPSSPQAGAMLVLGTKDGSPMGLGDCLGKMYFGGDKALGASIKAFASANWDSLTAPSYLSFGTTPNGQLTPVDHMFLSDKGFLGIDAPNPSAPLHIAAQNKNGLAAIFEGAIKIGSSEASATVAGRGAFRYDGNVAAISDGNSWRNLVLEG